MPSSYPGAADSFGAPAASDPQSTPVGGRTHSQSHTDLGDAVEAIETELGLNPSGAAATVVARLDAHDASTSPHIPAGAVSGSGAVGAVKWDETVGRRCFVWDTVNSRWQMVYGDTGWRDIRSLSALPGDTTLSHLKIRRVNDTVHLYGFIIPGATMTAAARWAGVNLLNPIPSGFRPGTPITPYVTYHGGIFSSGGAARHFALSNTTTPTLLTLALNGDTVSTNWTGANYIFSTQWPVYEVWPTTLPGVADGAIPYS